MRKTKKNKVNIPLYAAAVLLCLTMISVYMTSGLYAKYTTSTTGSDSARVAKFQVTETTVSSGESLKTGLVMRIAPGESLSYQVAVKNESEVAIRYQIAVENKYRNLPLEFICGDTGVIAATDHTEHVCTLTVSWPEGQNDGKYAGMVDYLIVTLTAAQVD